MIITVLFFPDLGFGLSREFWYSYNIALWEEIYEHEAANPLSLFRRMTGDVPPPALAGELTGMYRKSLQKYLSN